jgi:LmbE family N-acetylglucosaminyl deacetylase
MNIMNATPAVVVAAHPDDEVLGASGVLATRPCTVVFVTDGVPPDAAIPAVGDPALAETRVAESRAAHERLGARVDTIVRLGFADQGLADTVGDVAHALCDVLVEHPGDIYVPAYQRGHPDHDAVYVAAQLTRGHLAARGDEPMRGWYVYTLYGLDHDGRQRFDFLDPDTFDDVRAAWVAPDEVDAKATALRDFASQLPDESVLAGWLSHPVPEHYASLPALTPRLPELRCFYEEIFQFSQFGIDPEQVTAGLDAALARSLDQP